VDQYSSQLQIRLIKHSEKLFLTARQNVFRLSIGRRQSADLATLCLSQKDAGPAKRMKVLAVDVGGTHVACGAIDGQKMLEVFEIQTDSRSRLENLLPLLSETLRGFSHKYGGGFSGIGFGFCGLVDSFAGRIVSTNHKYSDATDVDLVAWARTEFDLPLLLENDARLALLGERHSGAAQGLSDVVMMTLGTGIGTAAMIQGKLIRGKHGQAGCLGGHFTIALGGRPCSCGARGCFEAEASTYALQDVSRTWSGFETSALAYQEKLDFETVFRIADAGDAVATQIRERSVQIWAACALSLVHAYDPESLVIGGGIMRSSYPILAAIQKHVDSYAWTPWGKVVIASAALGHDAPLLGAVPLLQEQR
jgi:glucokinase